MASTTRKCPSQQQRSKQPVTGKSKKLSQSHTSQISALKANNRQLATALDELRQDYRKLQQENLQLKQERQALLEKVASLEKTARRKPFSELLKEAQSKLHEVQSSLDFVLKTSRESPRCKQPRVSPPFSSSSSSSSSSKKVLRFSSPTQAKRCTIYPRTPHPLYNMTCVVDGPQLASTPVKTGPGSSSSSSSSSGGGGGPCLKLNYSDSSISATKELPAATATDAGNKDRVSVSQQRESGGCNISPIGELMQQKKEVPAITDHNCTMDQLEDALDAVASAGGNTSMSIQRPRRKCASLSLSYQEPTLKSKLRRGDPFTEQITDWNPPDHKDRRKKINKKTNVPTQQRKILCEVQNQL